MPVNKEIMGVGHNVEIPALVLDVGNEFAAVDVLVNVPSDPGVQGVRALQQGSASVLTCIIFQLSTYFVFAHSRNFSSRHALQTHESFRKPTNPVLIPVALRVVSEPGTDLRID